VCSGKEYLHENHLHGSLELPIRKKEMKKTIAILLVMTIALAGVFAAQATDHTLKVTTEIDAKSFARIVSRTSGILADDASYEQFLAVEAIAEGYSRAVGKTLMTLANLNFFSNEKVAFNTRLSAENMKADGVDSEIGYVVTVGDDVSVESDTDGTTSTTINLKPVGSASSLAGTKAIAVDVIDQEWDNASAGSYTGILTFNFITI
jgi:hypothetical protein